MHWIALHCIAMCLFRLAQTMSFLTSGLTQCVFRPRWVLCLFSRCRHSSISTASLNTGLKKRLELQNSLNSSLFYKNFLFLMLNLFDINWNIWIRTEVRLSKNTLQTMLCNTFNTLQYFASSYMFCTFYIHSKLQAKSFTGNKNTLQRVIIYVITDMKCFSKILYRQNIFN